jgi:hypothetical protein
MARGKIIPLLLVVGLLLAQLAQAVHASDFLAHAHDEPCDICLLSSGPDDALPVDAASTWPAPCVASLPVTPVPRAIQTRFNRYLSRAPPETTLDQQTL